MADPIKLPLPGPEYADLGLRLRMLEGVEYLNAPSLIVTRWLPVRAYVGPDGSFSVPARTMEGFA